MPRKLIPLVSGEIYHVYNRGADKRKIFLDKSDYMRFYQSLYLFNRDKPVMNFDYAQVLEKKDEHKKLVSIHAYALLPNHYHLLVEQLLDNGISEFIKRISGGYTSFFNEKYERSGVLFQGKFKRVHVSQEEQYNYLFAYINENHHVHNIPRSDDVYLSSSFHFQNKKFGKVIQIHKDYNQLSAQKLARSIFEDRSEGSDLIE